LLLLVAFGVCGITLKFAIFRCHPLRIGFILDGGMMEDNFGRSMRFMAAILSCWERR